MVVNGHVLTNGQWIPVPPAVPAPPPPPPPPPPVAAAPPPPPVTSPFGTAPGGPAPVFAPTAGRGTDLAASAWTSGLPLGRGYIVQIKDVEAGTSRADNPKLSVTGVTLKSNGQINAGYKAVWSYTLTAKAIGKLGRDMNAVGIGKNPNSVDGLYPPITDGPAFAQALLAAGLRDMVVVVDSVESSSSELPDVNIVSCWTQNAAPPPIPAPMAPPPAAYGMPPGPPPAPSVGAAPPPLPPAVTFTPPPPPVPPAPSPYGNV
jgi:hypothetical protein